MTFLKNILWPGIILVSILLFRSFSQEVSRPVDISRLELLHADLSRGYLENGLPLKILEGNVHARQDTLELFCDRAVYDETNKVLHLMGKIRMYRGRDTLLAREARYFEESKIAVAEGDVRVFRPAQEMKSDYLEYSYKNDHIRASGNLFLRDRENQAFITAEQGEYLPDKNYSYVKEKAHFWRIDSTSSDTIHIYSRQMEYYFAGDRRAIANDSVRIVQENLLATCDSAIYQLDQDIIFLKSGPVATQENNKITGEEMQLVLRDRELEKIIVTGKALAVSTLDSLLNEQDRLEGREIIMFISDRKLREIHAISNARSYYHLKEKTEDRGINVASADTIKAFLQENELDSIAVIGGAQGTYYPQDYKGKILQE
jgi:lipopolysaccharide assembly outer membrane protein LptD (OstA)